MYNFLEFFRKSRNTEQSLTAAIIDGDLEAVKRLAPYVDLNHHFKETGELPVFFALKQHQPEIASYLVEEHHASVDIKYPGDSLYKGKCSFELALLFAAKGLMPPSYLSMVKNFSAPGQECYFGSAGGEHYELSAPNCFTSGRPTECKNLPNDCLNVEFMETELCSDYKVEYTHREEIIFIFDSTNSTYDKFDSIFNDSEKVIETHYSYNAELDSTSINNTIYTNHNLRGNIHSAEDIH